VLIWWAVVHRQSLQHRLNEENKKRLDARTLTQNKLNRKRYIKDYSVKDRVFKAFEKEAGTGRSIEGLPLATVSQQASSPSCNNLPSLEIATSKRQKIRPTIPDLKIEFPACFPIHPTRAISH
jgi:hypothetical protein